ncbi:MAG: RNA polymerase sigma factor [Clostridia bacterium]|nr:RNA polymerase sigma factor [Clostridia bacterium]
MQRNEVIPMTDELLLRRAKSGDTAAFEQLAAPCEAMIWRVCVRILRHEEDARDAVQDAMLAAWQKLSTFDGQSSFSTWVCAIAVHRCQDLLRRQKVRQAESLENMREGGYEPADTDPGPSERLEAKERRERVRRALLQLPEDQRVPLILFCMEGKRYEEIAEITGVPIGTVKSRVSRARDRLRELVREDASGNISPFPASKESKGGRVG